MQTGMLESILLKSDFRCFKAGDTFSFKPGVNLLVGDQGTGKSTIIYLIRDFASKRPTEQAIEVVGDAIAMMSFDFETELPRNQSYLEDSGTRLYTQLAMKWSSHGECVQALLMVLEEPERIVLFMMDEPDMALSVRSCHHLVKSMKEAVKRGCQIIAAVHNPIIISSFSNVLSIEHNRWMSSEKFLESQKKPLRKRRRKS